MQENKSNEKKENLHIIHSMLSNDGNSNWTTLGEGVQAQKKKKEWRKTDKGEKNNFL